MNPNPDATDPITSSPDFRSSESPAPTSPRPASEDDKAAAAKLGVVGGAASGVTTGVAIGAATAGPVGAAVGGVIGGVAGAVGGKALVEAVGPAADDDAYWADAHLRAPYYRPDRGYEWYRPAYELGWSGVERYPGRYEDAEPRLADDWLRAPGRNMAWDEARPAVRAAWERAIARRATTAARVEVADPEAVVDVLNDLLVMSRDGEQGFRNAAEHAASQTLRDTLQRRASDCVAAIVELQAEIQRLGGSPSESGSVSGALHRGWTALKTVFSSNDDKVVLDECVRGEEAAVEAYREALGKPLPAHVRALVQRQADGVARNYAEVLRMRDALPS